MSGNTERLQVLVPASWLGKVDDWRFANRVGTRSDAVRQLVEKGIEAAETGAMPHNRKGPATAATVPDLNTLNPA